jgi:hypothetical protein
MKIITYFLLIITQVFADDIKGSNLDNFANSLSYSVTNKQVFINIPTYYAPWNNLSVFQYKIQNNIIWASNSSSFFINSSPNSINYETESNITQLNLPNQIGAVYNNNQPDSKFNYITYVSPILNESINNNNNNVSFVVLINYTNSDSLYALINASFD